MVESLFDVLRDPVWGAILEFLAIAATVLIFVAERQRKELSILTVSQPHDPLQTADGTRVVPAKRHIIKLINTGRVPILPVDFERPARFYIPYCVIHDFRISNTKPKYIAPETALDDGGGIVLSPILMNPGDSITFEAIF